MIACCRVGILTRGGLGWNQSPPMIKNAAGCRCPPHDGISFGRQQDNCDGYDVVNNDNDKNDDTQAVFALRKFRAFISLMNPNMGKLVCCGITTSKNFLPVVLPILLATKGRWSLSASLYWQWFASISKTLRCVASPLLPTESDELGFECTPPGFLVTTLDSLCMSLLQLLLFPKAAGSQEL